MSNPCSPVGRPGTQGGPPPLQGNRAGQRTRAEALWCMLGTLNGGRGYITVATMAPRTGGCPLLPGSAGQVASRGMLAAGRGLYWEKIAALTPLNFISVVQHVHYNVLLSIFLYSALKMSLKSYLEDSSQSWIIQRRILAQPVLSRP